MNDAQTAILLRIERELIAQRELNALGHRVIYDRNGNSLNIPGIHLDPSLLDQDGRQIRLEDD